MVLLTASPSLANTVDINSLLTNASFENGLTGWIVNPSGNPATATSYTPLSTQYPAPNGLASGFIPDGTHVASTPTDLLNNGSSVALQQILTGNTWQSSVTTTYTLNLYVGLPATCPTGSSTACSAPDLVQVQLGVAPGGNLVGANLHIHGTYTVDGGASTAFSTITVNLPKPIAGDWEYIQMSFVVDEVAAGPMAVGFNGTAGQSANNKEINWDIVSAPSGNTRSVPGPVVGAGLPGLLAGFGAMLAWYRKRRAVVA